MEGGVNLVQLREKDLPGGRLLEIAERLRTVTEGSALFFINERLDVAMACGADGVQLGEDGIPARAAREVVGEGRLIGRSVHSAEGAADAEAQGADFLVVGSVFPTTSHPTAGPGGLRLLSKTADRSRLPFVGIGGITAANVQDVIGAGASGAAVISSILASEDPRKAARELKDSIDASWQHVRLQRREDRVAPTYPSKR